MSEHPDEFDITENGVSVRYDGSDLIYEKFDDPFKVSRVPTDRIVAFELAEGAYDGAVSMVLDVGSTVSWPGLLESHIEALNDVLHEAVESPQRLATSEANYAFESLCEAAAYLEGQAPDTDQGHPDREAVLSRVNDAIGDLGYLLSERGEFSDEGGDQ